MALNDFGKKIGGARKDLRGTFHREDLLRMTHIERVKMVRKDMVWPTPDFADLVDNHGVTKEAAAAVKMLRDAFAAAPVVREGTPEAEYLQVCEYYVEALNAAKELAAGIRTQAELAERITKSADVKERLGTFGITPSGRATFTPSERLLRWRCSHHDLAAIGTAIRCAGSGQLDYDIDRMLHRNPDWPHGTSRAEVYLRKHRVSVIQPFGRGVWVVAIHKRQVGTADREYYSRTTVLGPVLAEEYPDRETALAALRTCVDNAFEAKRVSLKAKRDALLGRDIQRTGHSYRVGPDYRNGMPAAGEDYLVDFGMRGGEFGLWVNQDERQQVVDRGYDGFVDLADTLKVSRGAVSLGGRLAIAFGARGLGGPDAAAAHYEPGRIVINLTKPHGEGTLAHEFGHALDHYLGDRARAIGLPIRANDGGFWLSSVELFEDDVAKVRPEDRAEATRIVAVNRAMVEIWKRTEVITAEQAQADAGRDRDRAMKSLADAVPTLLSECSRGAERNGATGIVLEAKLRDCEGVVRGLATLEAAQEGRQRLDKAMEALRSIIGRKGHLKYIEKEIEQLHMFVRVADRQVEEARSPDYANKPITRRRPTEYQVACRKLDRELGKTKAYFALKVEMFARAFEASVFDDLEAHKRHSTFLVSGVSGPAHPQGAERRSHLEVLFPALREIAALIPTPEREPTAALPVTAAVEADKPRPTTSAVPDESQCGSLAPTADDEKVARQIQQLMDFYAEIPAGKQSQTVEI